jgi:hypothetical protein
VDLFGELSIVTRALAGAAVDYALCGAVALAIHGAPRATKDIDLLLKAEDLPRFRDVVRPLGFDIEALPMTFSSSGISVHRFTKLADSEALMIDVLVASGALEGVFATRREVPYDDGSLWVVSRKGLVTLKLAANRPQDLVDIQRLKEASDGGDDA